MRSTQQVRDEVRKLVGIRLRQMRGALNYTQEAVASDLSLAHSTICSYESGTRAMSIDRLADFAAYFDVPISDLFSPRRANPVGENAGRGW
jgi:transcriptional regulator with XRE-family HTH domain